MTILLMETSAIEVVPLAGVVLSFKRAVERIGVAMKNTVTETFNIDVIFAFSHCRDVVAAVSKAGGFGVLGAVGHSPDALEIDLKWIEDEIGEHPYGVDLIVPAKYEGSDEGGLTVHKIADMIPAAHHEYVTEIEKYDVPELAETKSGQFS